MELRNLRTFQILAECLNFTEAARRLNFTQPTITAQIQSLERELKQSLFYRVGKQNYLTPAGKLLENYTDQIFQIIDAMENEFEKLKAPPISLNIAASEYYCINHFPLIISEYLKIGLDTYINLISCKSDKVIRGVIDNEYDLGVIAGHVSQSGLKNIVLEEEELLPVVSKDVYDKYPVSQIIDMFPFIKFKIDGGFQTILNNFIAQFNFPPKKTIEFGSEEAIRRAIKNGVGYGLLSKKMIGKASEQNDMIYIPISDQKMIFQTSLIYLESNQDNDALKSFCKLVKSTWEESYRVT